MSTVRHVHRSTSPARPTGAIRPTLPASSAAARLLLLGGVLAGPVVGLSAGTAGAAAAPLPVPPSSAGSAAGEAMPPPDAGTAIEDYEEYGGLSQGRIEAYEAYLARDDVRSEALARAFPGVSAASVHQPAGARSADSSDGWPRWGVAGTAGLGVGLLAGTGLTVLVVSHSGHRRPVRPA